MATHLTVLIIYLISFAGCLYALTCIQFEKFCNIRTPWKVQLLVFFMAIAMGYLVAQFVLVLTIYNGL